MRVPLTTINQLFSYLSQRQDSNLTKSLPLPQLYLHILFIILIFVVRNKNIFIHFKIDNNMVNLYKLTNLLESGMTIFQLNQMDLLRGCDDQYFDYNVDEVDMVLYGATLILEQEKYKPLIMQKFQHYKDNFNEEEHAEVIDYYLNFLEKPETLYTFTEKTINLLKSPIK